MLETGRRLLLPCLGLRVADLDKYRLLGANITVVGMDMDRDRDADMALLVDAMTALSIGVEKVQRDGGRRMRDAFSPGRKPQIVVTIY